MDLNNICGLGPKKIDYLNQKGINSLNDLILFYPINYILYGDHINEERFLIKCTLSKQIYNKKINGKIISFFTIIYKGVSYKCNSFSLKYTAKNFKVNNQVYLYGKYDKCLNVIYVERLELFNMGYIIPIYSKVEGFSSKTINKFINLALEIKHPKNYQANYIMHNPQNIDQLSNAMFHLKVEEYKEYRLRINDLAFIKKLEQNNFRFYPPKAVYLKLNEHNITLTKQQELTAQQVYSQLATNKYQDILLLGEVGSGKSYIMLFSILCNLKDQQQILIVLPTKILAQQFFEFIIDIIPSVELVTNKSNQNTIDNIAAGITKVVISTHCIANKKFNFNNLSLIIFDEQQRYGVDFKQQVISKSKIANIIEVSATPIPRTLSQHLYGLKTIIRLDGDNNHINSHLMKINEIYKVIDNTLTQGKQLLIICPSIDQDISGIWSVNKTKEIIKKNYKSAIIHSQLSSITINKRIEAFKKLQIQVLISTSILEVGVNFHNLADIIVLNADYFGLAQLHQFRGRVGRVGQQSNCYYHYDGVNNTTLKRLNFLLNENSGELVAQFDMLNRGYGDVIGIEQSGNLDFKLFNPQYDNDVIHHVIEHIIK